jgi:hypothetical protein
MPTKKEPKTRWIYLLFMFLCLIIITGMFAQYKIDNLEDQNKAFAIKYSPEFCSQQTYNSIEGAICEYKDAPERKRFISEEEVKNYYEWGVDKMYINCKVIGDTFNYTSSLVFDNHFVCVAKGTAFHGQLEEFSNWGYCKEIKNTNYYNIMCFRQISPPFSFEELIK